MKLVLFDCDGTLVDSLPVIHGCMVRSFQGAGLPVPSEARTRSIIGLSLNLAVRQLAGLEDPALAAALAQRYRENFIAMRVEPDFVEPAFPGVLALLETLGARHDIVLGMVTGKARRGVQAVLASHGLGKLFGVVRTADDCPSKPHPAMVLECCAEVGIEPADTVVVGDAVYDMQMACSAGATAVGVAWGYHDVAALQKAGAARVLREPAELLGLLEGGGEIDA